MALCGYESAHMTDVQSDVSSVSSFIAKSHRGFFDSFVPLTPCLEVLLDHFRTMVMDVKAFQHQGSFK